MDKTTAALSGQFLKVMSRILVLDKSNILTIEGKQKLYPSEIHLILALGSREATDFSGLVNHLGITKGAVSQTITRLVNKGILKKYKDNATKGLSISFTPFGEKTYRTCVEMRERLSHKISSYFSSISKDENEAIGKFINYLDATLDKYSKNTR